MDVVGTIRGSFALSLVAANTVLSCLTLYVAAIPKFIPIARFRKFSNHAVSAVAAFWVNVNCWITDFTQRIDWDLDVDIPTRKDRSYLILSNHQSWVDIVVLQRVFRGRIPLPRFFIKKVLFWVPFLGPAWWALDFPFMNRYSKEYLEKHPEKKNQDRETTKKRCERFREFPTAILIFAEGTRFTEEKREKRASPYRHLLTPKAGGFSAVMEVMGEQFAGILDVTIAYPDSPQSMWGMLSGKVRSVKVKVESIPMDPRFLENNNYAFLKSWLEQRWTHKDQLLETMVGPHVQNQTH